MENLRSCPTNLSHCDGDQSLLMCCYTWGWCSRLYCSWTRLPSALSCGFYKGEKKYSDLKKNLQTFKSIVYYYINRTPPPHDLVFRIKFQCQSFCYICNSKLVKLNNGTFTAHIFVNNLIWLDLSLFWFYSYNCWWYGGGGGGGRGQDRLLEWLCNGVRWLENKINDNFRTLFFFLSEMWYSWITLQYKSWRIMLHLFF